MMTLNEAYKADSSFYAEYDDDTHCWGVFGINSGFCYGQFGGKVNAENLATSLNKGKGK